MQSPPESSLHLDSSGRITTYSGPDAVELFHAKVLLAGLKLYASCSMKPSRAWTPSAMLRATGALCGKTYKRGQYLAAAADLQIWINNMTSALPITQNRS